MIKPITCKELADLPSGRLELRDGVLLDKQTQKPPIFSLDFPNDDYVIIPKKAFNELYWVYITLKNLSA